MKTHIQIVSHKEGKEVGRKEMCVKAVNGSEQWISY